MAEEENLVERLREMGTLFARKDRAVLATILGEAADLIERLRAELDAAYYDLDTCKIALGYHLKQRNLEGLGKEWGTAEDDKGYVLDYKGVELP